MGWNLADQFPWKTLSYVDDRGNEIVLVNVNGEQKVRTPAGDYISQEQWRSMTTEIGEPPPPESHPALKKPDWEMWVRMPYVQLIEAVALSCDIDPTSIFRPPCSDPEFLRRLAVADRQYNANNIPHVEGPGTHVAGNQLNYVRLHDFAKLAKTLNWPLPPSFPRLPDEVDWEIWSRKTYGLLWQVVAVSLNLSPDHEPREVAESRFPKDYGKRLLVATESASMDLPTVRDPPEPGGMRPNWELINPPAEDPSRMAMATVRLIDFSEWAERKSYSLPERFPRAIKGSAPKPEQATQPEKSSAPAQVQTSKWPWGEYETAGLRHLSAAVAELWIKYDPADPRTAPTNRKVIAWLKKRGVSERIARAIATLIRVDKLPPGPRPIPE